MPFVRANGAAYVGGPSHMEGQRGVGLGQALAVGKPLHFGREGHQRLNRGGDNAGLGATGLGRLLRNSLHTHGTLTFASTTASA